MARKAPFRERMTRRLAIASGRGRRSFPGAAPKHRSVYLHLPKCGGTSLSEAMYATVPVNQRIGVIDAVSTRRALAIEAFDKDDAFLCHEDLDTGQMVFDLRETMMLQHMAWDTMLIHGHVFWSDKAERHFGDTYKYVTMMRDPVARTVSNFRMAQRTGVVAGGMEEYLASDVAKRHARVFLRYLASRNDIPDADLPAAIELAKARVEKFALIGFLDDIDSFFSRYREIFGVSLRMSQLNSAPDRKPDIPQAEMEALRTLCAPDLEIFEHARSLR